VFQFATGINQPKNVHHLFGDWLHGFNNVLKTVFILGATMMCWALWIHRNDLVFEKKTFCDFASYPFGDSKAFKLGYPSARGGAVVGCGGIVTLGANGHCLFLPGAWVAI
jgi:hypothetical protein